MRPLTDDFRLRVGRIWIYADLLRTTSRRKATEARLQITVLTL